MRVYKKLNEYFKLVKSIDNVDAKMRNTKGLFDELKKAMQINSRLLGHYLTRTTALSSFDWSIVGEDSSKIESVIARAQKVINYMISNHANTPFYGATLYRLDFENSKEGTRLYIAETVPNANFDYDLEWIHFYENGKYVKSVPEEENELYLLDVFNTNLKGGLLRSIMPLEIIRFDMVLENANYLRKLKGILQIINKGGASPESESAAEGAAKNAIENNFFISDDLIELKLNEIAGQGGQHFRNFIDMINRDISIAILGQANTSELPNSGGSRAALEVMRLISKDIFYSDMVRMESLINRYLLIDYRLNYDKTAGKLPYKFRFDIEEEQDIEKNAAALEAVNRVLPIKKEEAYKFVNFTPPTEDDEIIPVKQTMF